MTVCSYYLRGQCKFGSLCKNEHPAQSQRSGFGNQGWGSGTQNAAATALPFSQESITKDMAPDSERPSWPLSSYGPAKMEPTLVANLDESPEELRWKAVQALKSGNPMDYQNYEAQKIQFATQTISNLLSNIEQAFKQAESSHASMSGQAASAPAFGKPTSFGASSSAATPTAFNATAGAPAFGKPAFGQSAFGQSSLGQPSKPTSVFGQPAQPVSAFGQLSQPTSAFGGVQPKPVSAFGQTSQPTSSFLRPATGFGTSSGGGFSAFASGGTSAFSGAAATQQQQAPAPAFGGGSGPSAFGAQTTPGQTAPVFGQPSQPPSAFGQPAQLTSAFGAGLPPKPASAFGQTQPTSAFNQPQTSPVVPAPGQTSQPTSAFGQPAQQTQQTQTASAFGLPRSSEQPKPFGAGLPPKPTTMTGRPDFQAAKAKLAGKTEPGLDRHDVLLPPDYADQLPEDARKAFEAERFEVGHIPLWLPPVEMR